MWKNWHSNNFEKQEVEKPMSQIPYILAAISDLKIFKIIFLGHKLLDANKILKKTQHLFFAKNWCGPATPLRKTSSSNYRNMKIFRWKLKFSRWSIIYCTSTTIPCSSQVNVSYNYSLSFPFSTWGENLFILVQLVVVVMQYYHYTGNSLLCLLTPLLIPSISLFLTTLPHHLLALCLTSAIPLMALSKVGIVKWSFYQFQFSINFSASFQNSKSFILYNILMNNLINSGAHMKF